MRKCLKHNDMDTWVREKSDKYPDRWVYTCQFCGGFIGYLTFQDAELSEKRAAKKAARKRKGEIDQESGDMLPGMGV